MQCATWASKPGIWLWLFSQGDIADMKEMCGDNLKLGAHGHIFCSAIPFLFFIKAFPFLLRASPFKSQRSASRIEKKLYWTKESNYLCIWVVVKMLLEFWLQNFFSSRKGQSCAIFVTKMLRFGLYISNWEFRLLGAIESKIFIKFKLNSRSSITVIRKTFIRYKSPAGASRMCPLVHAMQKQMCSWHTNSTSFVFQEKLLSISVCVPNW